MAIEGIKNSIMSQQVARVEKAAPVEKTEAVQVSSQNVAPVIGRQAGYESKEDDEKRQNNDEGKNLQDVSPEKVKSALADINKKIAPTQTQCEFKYHEKTHRISITVRDKQTDKVIKEIPPEKTLDMIAKSLELAGILVDEKR